MNGGEVRRVSFYRSLDFALAANVSFDGPRCSIGAVK